MHPLFDATEIERWQADLIGEGMPDTFSLLRDTHTPGEAGGTTVTTVTSASGSCRLRAAGAGKEMAIADQRGYQTPQAVDLSPDVDVTPQDRIVISSRTFEIGGISKAGAWATKQTLIVQELK